MNNTFSLRFLVPPLLTAFFTLPFISTKSGLWNVVTNGDNNLIINLVGGLTLLLVFGFIISSIANTFVNAGNLRIVKLSKEEKDYLKGSQEVMGWHRQGVTLETCDEIDLAALEIFEWIGESKNSFIKEQVSKRWTMAMANLNSVCALFLAPLLIILAHTLNIADIAFNHGLFLFVIWISLLLIYHYNFKYAHNSVCNLARLLIFYTPEKTKSEGV